MTGLAVCNCSILDTRNPWKKLQQGSVQAALCMLWAKLQHPEGCCSCLRTTLA